MILNTDKSGMYFRITIKQIHIDADVEPAIIDEYLEEEMAHAEMMDRGADDDKGREEPIGCWEGLVTRVSAIWRTTDMLSG